MHFRTLATVHSPITIEEDKAKDLEIAVALAELKARKDAEKDNVMIGFCMEELKNLQSSFARAVDREICGIMDYYSTDPINPEYLSFEDYTEDLRMEYDSTADCIRLPQGKIVEANRYPLWGSFVIRDGKVFQREAGPLKHEKRTKKAKRMKALPEYPRKKLYASFEDYAENERGFSYDEEHRGYGYICNPNAMWDWYQIGGRWPEMFLVKDSCTEYSVGERSWCNEDSKSAAPEGYIWVCAAKKKDIEWQVMREWREKKAREHFSKLEKMFVTGQLEEGFRGAITPQGVLYYGKMVYFKDESVEDYLNRYDILDNRKYPVYVHDIVDAGNWFSREDFEWINDSAVPVDWPERIDGYIDNLGDEDVLVGVDYHI